MYPYSCEGCGTVLKLTDQHLGRKIRCPRCRSVLEIPEFSQQFEQEMTDDADGWEGDDAAPFPGSEPATDYPWQPADKIYDWSYDAPAEEPADESPWQPAVSGSREGSANEFSRVMQEDSQTLETSGEAAGGVKWGTVIFGVGLMIVSAVWFVGGLAAGVIFFYPPILLIIGLVTLIKGLFGYE
jgi:phage FluMu protein Com